MLQIGNEPCGKLLSVVVGVSRDNPHLHVFASVKRPKKPLILRNSQWEALANAKDGIALATDWVCGDHASGEQTEVALSARAGEISATRLTYGCRSNKEKGRLIKKQDF